MNRYRYTGDLELRTPLPVKPGDEVECEREITHPHFKLLRPKKASPAAKRQPDPKEESLDANHH